jgi:hypothetical protein
MQQVIFLVLRVKKKWWEKFYRQSQAYLVDHKALSLLYGRCNLLHTLHISALANISNPAICCTTLTL